MKYIIKNILILISLLFIVCCKKDIGNYSYHEIDSVFINQIENTYVLKVGSNPRIIPKMTHHTNKAFAPAEYDYEWAAYRNGFNEEPKIIGKNESLNENISLAIGDYTVYFNITEKATGIIWHKKFTIKVSSGFNGGWMILSGAEGKAKIDFFEWNHVEGNYLKHHKNFQDSIKDVKGNIIPLVGNPKFITTWNNQTVATGNGFKYFVYVGTDQTTEKTNVSDGFIWSDQYTYKYETSNPQFFQTVDKIIPTASRDGYVVKDNDVYVKVAVYQLNVGTPVNRLSDGSYFKVSPFIAATSGPTSLMYDITNKRFVRNGNYSSTSQTPLSYDETNSAFNPNKVNMDLVWMNQTSAYGGQAFAVLTKDGKYYLARMTNNASFSASFLNEITSIPEISKATRFEVDQRYGYLQYVVGGKIYQYDPNDGVTRLMKDYGHKEITVFKYLRSTYVTYATVTNPNNSATYGKRFLPNVIGLVVGTFDPASPSDSGNLEIFDVPQFNASYTLFQKFSGFGKVADATESEFPFGW